jgi:hypothetical protein
MTVRKIRDDFVGVVYAPNGDVLEAGDEVPQGLDLGDHLFDQAAEPAPEEQPAPEAEPEPAKPAANKSTVKK